MSLTIHMMTAALSTGDAIGNYILSLTHILRGWGCTVKLYSDYPNPSYPLEHTHSGDYEPTGRDILWMHYSIYSDNVRWIRESHDFTVLDSHNVCPAYLFHGYDVKMEELCRLGEQILDTLQNNVDLAIAHTDYVYDDLRRRGYRFIRKIPIIVDTSRFTGEGSPEWEPLLHSLEYLIFVGRIVPQKDLMLALKVFAELHRRRPHLILFLVGPLHIPKYAAELTQLAEELRIVDSVVFVGRVTEPAVLTSFYQHARYYLALSAWESFCVPIAESLYFGTPILGHAVPPIPETMGLGGIILEGTPEHMAAQIDARWEIDDTYQQLQKAGYAHAAQFTEPALRAALLEVFRTLAEWR